MLKILQFLSLITLCRAEFKVSGRIETSVQGQDNSFNSLKSSRKYEVGDRVNFDFFLNFTGAQDLTFINLIISGSSMKFIWTLQNGGIYVEMKSTVVSSNTPLKPMEQNISPSEDRLTATILLKNNNVPLKSASGKFVMKIQDISNVYSILKVVPEFGESKVFTSEQIRSFVPGFNISNSYPSTIRMKEKSSFNVSLSLPLSSFKNSYAKVYMPYNDYSDTDSEAKMTVSDFKVTAISEVSPILVDMLQPRLHSVHLSRSMTSEEDMAILKFPSTNTTEDNNDVVSMTVLTEGTLQDFKEFSPGDFLEMGIGYKVQEDFIWISSINVTIDSPLDDKIPRRPLLNTDLSELTRTLTNGILNLKMRLTVDHDVTSNGTAYDVVVGLYLPPTVTFVASSKRHYDVVKRANLLEYGRTVYCELIRVSFPHTSRIIFNVTIDTTSDLYETTDSFQIAYEVIYSGWRREEEYSNALQMFEFVLLRETDEETDFSSGLHCPCLDNKDLTCACCKKGGCQCGKNNPNKCVTCERPFMCVDTIEGYYKSSVLQDVNGTTYTCDDRSKMRHGRPFASCMSKNILEEETVLSPFVSVVVGFDYETNVLYGISNNGQGYVISKDLGKSWCSIPSSVVSSSSRSHTFLNASYSL